MPDRPKKTLRRFAPRKLPRQKRSQVVFDKIVATARQLFEREGYTYVSTNKIAEKANVSIGSLYQYFSDRESIALAIYENASSRAARTMKGAALELLSLPLEESIPRNIERLFDVFEKDRYALLQLINEVPELRSVSQPISFANLIHHTHQMFLEQHFHDVDRAIIARKCYVIEKCVMGTIGHYLDERPDVLNRSQALNEITELVQQYVQTLSRHRTIAARSGDIAE